MADLIDRLALSDLVEGFGIKDQGGVLMGDIQVQEVLDLIGAAPAVDAVPMVHAEWTSCKDRLPVPEDREIWAHCLVTLRENAVDRFWEESTYRSYTLPADYDPVQKIWHFEASEPVCAHAQVNALLGEEIMTDEDGEMVNACYVSHWMPYPEPAKEE